MLYSGTWLTEVALYPAFVLALLGIAAAAGRPSRRNQLLALGGIGLACTAKPLAVVLVPAYLLIIFHLAVLDARSGARRRDTIRRYRLTLTALAVAVVVVIGGSAARGNPDAVFGVYGVVLGNIDLSGGLVWFVRHLAGIDLYVALVPFAATLLVVFTSVRRSSDRAAREFSALATWDDRRRRRCGRRVRLEAVGRRAGIRAERGATARAEPVRDRAASLDRDGDLARAGTARESTGSRSLAPFVAGSLPLLLPLGQLVSNARFQALSLIPWAGDGMTELWPLTFLPLAVVAAVLLLVPFRHSATACWTIVALAFAWTTLAAALLP